MRICIVYYIFKTKLYKFEFKKQSNFTALEGHVDRKKTQYHCKIIKFITLLTNLRYKR